MTRHYLLPLAMSGAVLASVPASDVYPMVEYWQAGDYRVHPICEADPNAKSVKEVHVPRHKAKSYPFRTDMGVVELADDIIGGYQSSNMASAVREDLLYSSIMKKRATEVDKLWAATTANVIASNRATEGNSFADKMCRYFEDPGLNAKLFCHTIGNFSEVATCLGNYEYEDPEAVLQSLDPAKDFGFSLSEECWTPVSAGRSSLGFELSWHPSTPDTIKTNVARSEWRYYMLAWKAIEHFSRYVEYKFTTEDINRASGAEPTPISIEDLSTNNDIFDEILPEWKVKHVFNSVEPRYRGGYALNLPMAVMAARDRGVLIVLREPTDNLDGRIGQYSQHQFTHLYNFTGAVHAGGATIFQSLSSVLTNQVINHYQARLTEETPAPEETTEEAEPNQATEPEEKVVMTNTPIITVVGAHQPMASAAVVIADHLQKQVAAIFRDAFGAGTGFQVQAITFGSPYVGNSAFNRGVRATIESRHLTLNSMKDIAPCPMTYACDERDLAARTGFITGVKYEYAKAPGQVPLEYDALTRQDIMWSEEKTVLQIAALDRCGLPCILASNACPSDDAMQYCSKSGCETFL